MTFDNLSGWKGYHYCEDGATQEETEVQDNPKSRKIFNTKDPLMHLTQKKFFFLNLKLRLIYVKSSIKVWKTSHLVFAR